MTVLELMQHVRTKYPENWDHAQRGSYLNEVAWELNKLGMPTIGMLSKPSGNNCPIPSGALCSCDYIVERSTMNGYDVLVNETIPVWPGFEHPTDNFSATPERWVAAVDPMSPAPEPPQPPPVSDVAARVTELERRMGAAADLFKEIVSQIGALNKQLADLTTVVMKPMVAEGTTDRYAFHNHDVKLNVRRTE